MQLRDLINSELTGSLRTVHMENVRRGKREKEDETAPSGSRTGQPNPSRETEFSGAKGNREKTFPSSADRKDDWTRYAADAGSAEDDDYCTTRYMCTD